jgi:hypothetical protein
MDHRNNSETTHAQTFQVPPGPPSPIPESDGRDDEVARLRACVGELQRERDHLVAIVDILQEISASLHFVDILPAIARKLGDAFGLDRCAIFLSGEQNEVRLVASYEDPTTRNLVVGLNRYPELQRAFDSGETVFILDATSDPTLRSIKGMGRDALAEGVGRGARSSGDRRDAGDRRRSQRLVLGDARP